MPDHGLFQSTHAGCIAADMDFARRGGAPPAFEYQFPFSKLGRTQHHPYVRLDAPE